MAKNLKYQLGFAPILLLLLILLGGVLVASYFLIFANTVKTVFVTDNNPEGAGVVWQTSAPSVSYLVADQGLFKTQLSVFSPSSSKITDIVEGNGRTHYAKLKNLSPNTTYALKIVVNGVVKSRVLITTSPKLADVSTPMPLMGEVLDQNSQSLKNSVVMVQLVSKTQTSKSSIILASKLSSEGKFAIDLSNIRTADLKNSFNYDSKHDQIQLTLLNDQGLATLSMSLEEAFSKQKFQFIFAQASAPLDKLIGIVYAGHFKESSQTPTNFCEDGKVTGEDEGGTHYFIRDCSGDNKCENGECVDTGTGDRSTPAPQPAPAAPEAPVAPLPVNVPVNAAGEEKPGSTFPPPAPTDHAPAVVPVQPPLSANAGLTLPSVIIPPIRLVQPPPPSPTVTEKLSAALEVRQDDVPIIAAGKDLVNTGAAGIKSVATAVVNMRQLLQPGKVGQIFIQAAGDVLTPNLRQFIEKTTGSDARISSSSRRSMAQAFQTQVLGISTATSEKGLITATQLQDDKLAITAPDGEITISADIEGKRVIVARGRLEGGKFYEINPNLEGKEGEIKLKGGRISLDSGWNLVALNVTPKKDYTAEDMLSEINAEGGEAVVVNRWIDNKWQTHVAGNFGTNFKIEVGHGYFVYAKKASAWLIPAQNEVTKPDVLIDLGWNLLTTTNLSIVKASQLLDHINTNSTPLVNADTVTQYVNNLWQSIKLKEGEVFGKDFEVTNRRSYFVKALNQGVWKSK